MKTAYPPFVGLFHAPTKQMILTSKATEIVAFHEMAHLKHFEDIGKLYFSLSKLEKEMYVWKQILANSRKWTTAEINESLRYLNNIRVDEYGLEIIKL